VKSALHADHPSPHFSGMAGKRKNPMTAQGTQHNDQNRLNLTDFGG
jgi:hypothetical protein